MRKLDYNESLIKNYAKRIYGFAYSKTHDTQNAEDLSQDILCALCGGQIAEKEIENMDAYIYRICQYSWSKYLRKNKRAWDALQNQTAFDQLAAESVEEPLIQKELYEKLRQEIMYLTKLKREIIILFYYENKSGKEISGLLGIPAGTVRWHLSQAKNDLKERIEMVKQDGIYTPVHLSAGRCGWGQSFDPCGLHTDVLMQNICWVCHGRVLSVEEIARTLGVAAVYLEDKIEKLLYLDYLKTVGKNKYQTGFFIPGADYQLAERKYHLEKTMPIAAQFLSVIKKALPEIRKTGFVPDDFDDNILGWQFLPIIVFQKLNNFDNVIIEKYGLQHSSPKHRDGGKYWPCASIRMSDILSTPGLSDELRSFCQSSGQNRIYGAETDKMKTMVYNLGFLTPSREFGSKELSALHRVHELIKSGETPNDYDKEMIAELIRGGYVSKKDGGLKILVPYFTKSQMETVNDILQKTADETLDMREIEKIYDGYIKVMTKLIPAWVERNERSHLLTGFSPFITILWQLQKSGGLKAPTKEEKNRIGIVVFEK